MAERNVFDKLMCSFENALLDNGVDYIRISCFDDFLRKIFEREMKFKGFVMYESGPGSIIFHLDTSVEPLCKSRLVQFIKDNSGVS